MPFFSWSTVDCEQFVTESCNASFKYLFVFSSSGTYMKDLLAAFSIPSSISRSDSTLLSNKRRYAELTSMSKKIAEKVSSHPELFERIKDVLTKELASLRVDEDIQDPVYVKGKGRPRQKRLKSSVESYIITYMLFQC